MASLLARWLRSPATLQSHTVRGYLIGQTSSFLSGRQYGGHPATRAPNPIQNILELTWWEGHEGQSPRIAESGSAITTLCKQLASTGMSGFCPDRTFIDGPTVPPCFRAIKPDKLIFTVTPPCHTSTPFPETEMGTPKTLACLSAW